MAKRYEKQSKSHNRAELDKSIKNLNTKTTQDQYGLNNILIKAVPINFRVHILSLFNKILVHNEFPDNWKQSEIFMLLKKQQIETTSKATD
jgi:hypothetical protein